MGPWNSEATTQCPADKRFPKFYEAFKANEYLQCLDRRDVVQIFCTRAKHTLLQSGWASHGWFYFTVWGRRQIGSKCCSTAEEWPLNVTHGGLQCPGPYSVEGDKCAMSMEANPLHIFSGKPCSGNDTRL
ncbi:hypothetical protein PoB_000355600 [Plakobranchus ocellatus]|uniref:Uncharacterized protein n=1 Tax=Plakobranchus ocellatus TaxID=259542 RepID=A0AAV3Y3S0_9GAST|nr:hypothetical protein PoB_000355600 [Plakobranchus ocellatus]